MNVSVCLCTLTLMIAWLIERNALQNSIAGMVLTDIQNAKLKYSIHVAALCKTHGYHTWKIADALAN